MFRTFCPRLLVCSLTWLSAELSAGDVVILQAVDDAYLSNSPGESNLPWDTAILEQFGYYANIKRPLLKFDLSSIPDGATVISAALTLQLSGIYGGQSHFTSVWRVPNDNWAEETVTWDSYDQTGAVSVAILPGTNYLGSRIWNIGVAYWTYGTDLLDNAVTFMVRWDNSAELYETDGYYKWNSYASKEGTAAPTLTLTTLSSQPVGDLNCDGTYGQGSFGDINPFVQYLSDLSAWQGTYPGCGARVGDLNCDGTYGQMSFGDINPFVLYLSNQSAWQAAYPGCD